MSNLDYKDLKQDPEKIVYVIQEIPGTKEGRPKISPGPIIFELRRLLKDYRPTDYLLLTGDPAIIGVACSVVSDITHGKYHLLKWDRQEKMYYPISINLYEKGKIDE